MLPTVEGTYHNGQIKLNELPAELTQYVDEEVRVIVTFLPAPSVDLRTRNIDETEAAELCARLLPFAEDWDAAEMDIYDNYEANLPDLSTR